LARLFGSALMTLVASRSGGEHFEETSARVGAGAPLASRRLLVPSAAGHSMRSIVFGNSTKIPSEIAHKWQEIVDLLATTEHASPKPIV
jgi:hypothetical protein